MGTVGIAHSPARALPAGGASFNPSTKRKGKRKKESKKERKEMLHQSLHVWDRKT